MMTDDQRMERVMQIDWLLREQNVFAQQAAGGGFAGHGAAGHKINAYTLNII
jgi:hypothetical protein